ncbi:hypothetical protein MUK42_33922 [Musa troglodytarum]|uniref:Uncharacterized protein n=1 Tax=Musa troglodytarum TaxID=320322 RepID=A0A9E7FKI9_9LILI|nr:hypothetical protein MUK42_33922 [Musa troglodytarum]
MNLYSYIHILKIIFPTVTTSRCSIVVSIPACHAGDPGSIPGNGATYFLSYSMPFLIP